MKDEHFEYDTETLNAFKILEEKAKKERYYDHAKAQMEALHDELAPDRTEELTRFRTDIEEVLRNEIVGRYYFQTGRAKASLATDPYVKSSIEVLNSARYEEVLTK
ncbi:MAG: hypothetical protein IPH05_10175 [Flavobacteriales bacterium]|nr:hypothetical protein [Flavobacteriales bacterium]